MRAMALPSQNDVITVEVGGCYDAIAALLFYPDCVLLDKSLGRKWSFGQLVEGKHKNATGKKTGIMKYFADGG